MPLLPIRQIVPAPAPRTKLFLRSAKHMGHVGPLECRVLTAACFNYPRIPESAVRTGDGKLRIHLGTEV